MSNAAIATLLASMLVVLSIGGHAAEQKLLPMDAADGDYFGESVGVSGDDLIVGAPYDDDLGGSSGSAYIFHFNGVIWVEDDKLNASDGEASDRFGVAVDIDGDWAVVGASYEDEAGTSAGAAYVFHDDGASWSQHAKLLAGDPGSYDHFGFAVAISGDTVIVGVPDSNDTSEGTGSAYIFVRDGGTWTQQAKLLASDREGGDNFGYAVGLASDTAVISSPYDDDACDPPNAMCNSGSAYVFTRSGSVWTQQSKLVASDDDLGDWFGDSVAIAGNLIVVGAPRDDEAASNAGAAYAFGGGGWAELDKLVAADGATEDQLGRAVAVSVGHALAGAPLDDAIDNNCGAVYTFSRGTPWTEVGEETADDGFGNNQFGNAVDTDGWWAVVGGYHFNSGMGAAYVYRIDDLDPTTLIFADGFETGTTSRWTATVP